MAPQPLNVVILETGQELLEDTHMSKLDRNIICFLWLRGANPLALCPEQLKALSFLHMV